MHDTQGVGIMFGRGCGGSVEGCRIEDTAAPGIQLDDGATRPCAERPTPARTAQGRRAARSSGATRQDTEKVEKLLAELDAMIGLAGVKAEVRALIDEIQVNEWRRQRRPRRSAR